MSRFKRIRVDDRFSISADKLQFVLERRRVSKESGVEYFTPESYHPNLGSLVHSLLLQKVRGEEFECLEQMSQRLEEIYEELQKIARDVINDHLSICV